LAAQAVSVINLFAFGQDGCAGADARIRNARDSSIYKEYVDHVSGDVRQRRAKRQNDRAYIALMGYAARLDFDCVLVWKSDGLRVPSAPWSPPFNGFQRPD
jgi:hypothetical protein